MISYSRGRSERERHDSHQILQCQTMLLSLQPPPGIDTVVAADSLSHYTRSRLTTRRCVCRLLAIHRATALARWRWLIWTRTAQSDWRCFRGCAISSSLGAPFYMYHISFCEGAPGTGSVQLMHTHFPQRKIISH